MNPSGSEENECLCRAELTRADIDAAEQPITCARIVTMEILAIAIVLEVMYAPVGYELEDRFTTTNSATCVFVVVVCDLVFFPFSLSILTSNKSISKRTHHRPPKTGMRPQQQQQQARGRQFSIVISTVSPCLELSFLIDFSQSDEDDEIFQSIDGRYVISHPDFLRMDGLDIFLTSFTPSVSSCT